jgi:outer membrane protein OmpA-like peptidoglycan-associated protein
MTSYSAKYAGYAIEKGKLTLQLKYLIDKRKLEAQNKVLLDQFTFGEKVDSPTATKLPVRFAISLLKDRNGLIDLDLPVTGSLDDPQFSVWGVIGKILINLLTKAATAPFALLGSVIGGSSEMSDIEFAYGSADLSSAAHDRLKTMAKVLFERPALQLDIAGRVDTEKDREALRQEQFDRKLKAQKLNALTKKGATTATLNDVKVEPNEYTRYLTLAYKKETFQKPRNVLGMAKDLEVPEMEKLILVHIIISEDDLNQLAHQRAEAVKDDLVTNKIEPSRIFLLAVSSKPSQGKSEKLKESRVDFVIK